MYIGVHAKCRYSGQIETKLEFSGQIFENTQISNYMTIRQKEAEFFHENGQTDMNLIVTFCNFVNATDGLHCTTSTHGSLFRLAIIMGQLPPRVWVVE